MREIQDMTGNLVQIPDQPNRVISLVPSQTELLIDLGLKDRIVGRTKFCIHPWEKVGDIAIVGGTKNYRLEAIDDLAPDLIIGNLEENEKEGILELRKRYPVWLSDIKTIEDAKTMIDTMGSIFEVRTSSDFINEAIDERIVLFKEKNRIPTLYLIWKNPFMAAGNDTFIHEMMQLSGFQNLVNKARYPELTLKEIRNLKPGLIMLSSEPFPFKEQHLLELKEQLPESRVVMVDGEMFSWYGSRLIRALDYLQELYEELQ